MDFANERAAVQAISETIVKAGVCLFNTTKYAYVLAAEDFYNCSIKDVVKIALNNITDCNALSALGLRVNNDSCPEMSSADYDKVLALIVYSFAARIPALKLVKVAGQTMDDSQLRAVYDLVIGKGAINYAKAIEETYDGNKRFVAKGKKLADYDAQWYKGYIFSHVPALGTISNKNVFLLGFADILFTLFYSCLEEELENLIMRLGTQG